MGKVWRGLGAEPPALGDFCNFFNKNNAFLCIFRQNITSHLPQRGRGSNPNIPPWLRHWIGPSVLAKGTLHERKTNLHGANVHSGKTVQWQDIRDRQDIRDTVQCPFGELSIRVNVRSGNCKFFSQLCIQGNVHSGKCIHSDKCLIRQMSIHSGKCYIRASVHSGKCTFGQVSVWANVQPERGLERLPRSR